MALHVPTFGGGIVLEGAADVQRTDELQLCDAYEIGTRGQLVLASDVSDYVTLDDLGTVPVPWTKLYRLDMPAFGVIPWVLAAGEGRDSANVNRYLVARFAPDGALTPISTVLVAGASVALPPQPVATAPVPGAPGVVGSIVVLPGLYKLPASGTWVNLALINFGAREGFAPNSAAGCYVLVYVPASASYTLEPLSDFDVLGTGAFGAVSGGTHAKQPFFRGIAAFNAFAMGWGWDASDATNGDGPARLLFSNIPNPNVAGPLTWGNDNKAGSGDRAFSDTDAIVIGDTGEIIRAGLTWNQRFWIGTNRQLHFLAGYGRQSFLTDGANPVAKAENVVGPAALIEGPDRQLYGVGDQGLWRFDGATVERLHRRLRDFDGRANGYWDLIWTDRTRGDAYPGKTNQDLVWLAVDWDVEAVVVGIPFCDATAGYGFGNDTVLVKFHTKTGGFTRQVLAGVQYTAADYARRQGQFTNAKLVGTATAGVETIRRYGYKATPAAETILPAASGNTKFGEYALFGPDGVGVYRHVFLTLAWAAAAALPLVFLLTPFVDGQSQATIKLTIGAATPAGPAETDLWLDTSGTDPNLGTGTSSPLVPAQGDYVLKLYRNGAWTHRPGGGQKGTRATIPVAFTPKRGQRFALSVFAQSAAGRFQLEGLGFSPRPVQSEVNG